MIFQEDAECLETREVITIGGHEISIGLPDDDFNKERQTLFATHLWKGAIELANFLVESSHTDPTFIQDRHVVEFGAGAGLPSIIAKRLGARLVCASDYPSPSVLVALEKNASINLPGDVGNSFFVTGHKWGDDVNELICHTQSQKYDIILASECLWKHGESHALLLQSMEESIRVGGIVIMTFSHHIPCLEANDLAFFDLAEGTGNFRVTSKKTVNSKHMWSEKIVDMHIYMMERL